MAHADELNNARNGLIAASKGQRVVILRDDSRYKRNPGILKRQR